MALTIDEENELAELEELERLEELEAAEAAEAIVGISSINREVELGLKEESVDDMLVGQVDAIANGFIEGVPFLKDAAALGTSLTDVLSNKQSSNAIDEISEGYYKNLESFNKDLEKSRQKHPNYVLGGEVGASIATSIAIPGVNTFRGNILHGALQGLSSSERRTAQDALAGGTTALVFDRLGAITGAGFKAVGKGIDTLASGSIQEAAGGLNKSGISEINRYIRKTGQTAQEFSDRLFSKELIETDLLGNVTRREPLFMVGQSFEDTLDKVQILKHQTGKQMGSILKSFDDVKETHIRSDDLFHSLKTNISDRLQSSADTDTKKIGKEAEKYIQGLMYDKKTSQKMISKDGILDMEVVDELVAKPDWTLSKVHNLQTDISAFIKQRFDKLPAAPDPTSLAQQKQEMVDSIRELIENKVDEASHSIDSLSLDTFKGIKKDFGNLAVSEKLLEKAAASQGAGPMGMLKNLIKTKGLIVSGVANYAGLDPVTSFALGGALNQFLASPQAPASMAVGIKKLSEGLERLPDPKIIRSILNNVDGTMHDFNDSIASGIAHYSLIQSPIQRSLNSLEQKKELIISAARAEAPQIAEELRKAYDSNNIEGVAAILESVEGGPEMIKYIAPGVGFDGRVFTPESKALLIKDIDKANLPLAQSLKLKEMVKQQGIIPDLKKVRQPEVKWKPRDKKNPKY